MILMLHLTDTTRARVKGRIKYYCPSCGHLLKSEGYWHLCHTCNIVWRVET